MPTSQLTLVYHISMVTGKAEIRQNSVDGTEFPLDARKSTK